MMFTVYLLTHAATTRHYVGKTNSLARRMANHRSLARRAHRSDSAFHIHAAIRKYSWDAFTLTVLEEFADEQQALETEAWWIAFLRSSVRGFGFNILLAGIGQSHTEETRRKIGEGRRGKPLTANARALIAAARRGQKATPETRAKMSASHAGQKQPLDIVARRASTQIGCPPEEWLRRRAAGELWCSRGQHWTEAQSVHRDACRPCANKTEREQRRRRSA